MPIPAPPPLRQRLARWALIRRDPQFRRGMAEMIPMLPGISAWGLVTGVAMVKSGLGVPLSMLMTLIVYAGSSQLASLPLIATGAPLWVIWLTAFIVNLRFVIYSVQWRQYFGALTQRQRVVLGYFAADMNLAMFVRAWPEPRPQPGQLPYLMGGVCVLWLGWQIPAAVGVVLADAIPPAWGLGFAGTLALLGLTCSLLVNRATWVSAGVAVLAAVAAFSLPYKLHIVVAVAAAVAAGLMMEAATARRTAPGASA